MTERRVPGPMESLPPVRLPRLGQRGPIVPDAATPNATPTPAADSPARADPVKLRELKTILADSPRGAAAVRYIETHHIPVVFAQRGGTFWDGHGITIDLSARSSASAAVSLVHEARHARTAREGHAANVRTDTRNVYIDRILRDEVSAKVDAIVTRNELVAAGRLQPSRYEASYNNAFLRGMAELQQRTSSASTAELAAAGEKSGYDALMKEYRDGLTKTSTSPHESYPDKFGRAWDNAHPSAPRETR